MTARIVAVGHVKPEHGTTDDSTGEPVWTPAEPAAELPDWLWNGGRPVEDDDLYRKQQIEDELAWGGDL